MFTIWQVIKKYAMEKRESSIKSGEKTGYIHVKECN